MIRLREIYQAKGFNRNTLAKELNLSPETIYRWEQGRGDEYLQKIHYLCVLYVNANPIELFKSGYLPEHPRYNVGYLSEKTGLSVPKVYELKAGKLGKVKSLVRLAEILELRRLSTLLGK